MCRIQAGPGGDDLREVVEGRVSSRHDLGELYVVSCEGCEFCGDEEPFSAEWALTILMPWTLGAMVVAVILAGVLTAWLKYR